MKVALSSVPVPDEAVALLNELAGAGDLDAMIAALARDGRALKRIEDVVQSRQTSHELIHGDARAASELPENSIHLVVTSPPYWTLKRYNEHADQMGHVADYDEIGRAHV